MPFAVRRAAVGVAIITLVAALLLARPASGAQFWDVPDGSVYAGAVSWLVGEGITTGVSSGGFAPQAPVTRGQMALFLWRQAGQPAAGSGAQFWDVPDGSVYAGAVSWLVGEGITTGVSSGGFAPQAPVTRGQMALFLWRQAGQPAAGSGAQFWDVPDGSVYAGAVSWLVGEGITTGVSSGGFAPQAPVTRGQMALFLWRQAGQPSPAAPPTSEPSPSPSPSPSLDPPPPPPPALHDKLYPDTALAAGEVLSSANGEQNFVMQGDGNLVLYRGSTVLWASGTDGHPGARVVMQSDGNLVVYKDGRPLWDSNTDGNPVAFLAVQDDGNVVIYAPTGRAVWSTNTVVQPPSGGGTTGGGDLASLCGRTYDYSCLSRFGYGAADTGTWAEWYYRYASSNYHNCTRFVAYYLAHFLNMQPPGGSFGDAWNWGKTDGEGGQTSRTSLKERGYAVDGTPRVGDIAWYDRDAYSSFGHVGVVVEVGAGYVIVASDSYTEPVGYTQVVRQTPSGRYPTGFIHVGTPNW